jgi:hypothetical protein
MLVIVTIEAHDQTRAIFPMLAVKKDWIIGRIVEDFEDLIHLPLAWGKKA